MIATKRPRFNFLNLKFKSKSNNKEVLEYKLSDEEEYNSFNEEMDEIRDEKFDGME